MTTQLIFMIKIQIIKATLLPPLEMLLLYTVPPRRLGQFDTPLAILASNMYNHVQILTHTLTYTDVYLQRFQLGLGSFGF